jgi:hypothetical protein
MFIPDPRSDFFPSRIWIRIKELKYFNPKKWFLSSRKYDPGCSSQILDPDPYFLPILDPGFRIQGSKSHRFPDPGSTTLLREARLLYPRYRYCMGSCNTITELAFNILVHLQTGSETFVRFLGEFSRQRTLLHVFLLVLRHDKADTTLVHLGRDQREGPFQVRKVQCAGQRSESGFSVSVIGCPSGPGFMILNNRSGSGTVVLASGTVSAERVYQV